MFTIVLLDCIQKLNRERSLSSIYHLLTGKRSSQTLQDAQLYELSHYFGIYKTLNRKEFVSYLHQLKETNYIITYENDEKAYLTNHGTELLESNSFKQEINCFVGLKYEKMTDVFETRLLLFIQTITNMKRNNKSFVTITEDAEIQRWVKLVYGKHKNKLEKWLEGLYDELHDFLCGLSHLQASIFVDRLTGFNRFGLSKQQIAQKYDLTIHDSQLLSMLINQKLLTYTIENQKALRHLPLFIDGLNDHQFITNSASKTLDLYKKGFTLEQIITMRNLKESTILDHFVEIAYIDSTFRIEDFITNKSITEIESKIKQLNSRKLKMIKESLHDKYSYFQIRLVLAVKQNNREKEIESS